VTLNDLASERAHIGAREIAPPDRVAGASSSPGAEPRIPRRIRDAVSGKEFRDLTLFLNGQS